MNKFENLASDSNTSSRLDEFYQDYLKAKDEIEETYIVPEGFFDNLAWRSYKPVSTETLRTRLEAIRDAVAESIEILEKTESGEPISDIPYVSDKYSGTPEEVVTYNAKNRRSENTMYFPDRYSEEDREKIEARRRAWNFICTVGSQHWAESHGDIIFWEKIERMEKERDRMLQERGFAEAYEADQKQFD